MTDQTFTTKENTKFQKVCYRGEINKNSFTAEPTDPGDLGVGKYWTTSKRLARQYGEIKEMEIVLNNPLKLNADEANALVDKYNTVNGLLETRIQSAIKMTKDLQAAGYDGLITDGYETPEGELAINVFPDEIDEQHFRNTPRYKLYLKHMEQNKI